MIAIRLAAIAFISFCLLTVPALGQEPSPAKPPPDLPRAVIADVKKAPDGQLVFAVRIYAPNSRPISLFHSPKKRDANVPKEEGDDDPLPFSLAGSTLKILPADKVNKCLPDIPREPYFGPLEVTTRLNAGGWMQMGVAFPALPPPTEQDGKKQPYQLLFEIPELKIKTPLKLDPDTLKPM